MDANERTIPILVGADCGAALLGLSRSTFLRMDRSGRLGPRSILLGRLRRWHRYQLEAWAAAGCPPRTQWRSYGGPHGGSLESGKSTISRPAGRATSRSKIRTSHGGDYVDRD